MTTIPKKLHFVWIGDDTLCPKDCIHSWRLHNPDYEIVVWNNEKFNKIPWINNHHMNAMMDNEICGVADMMRYEILFNHGGIALDADSFCVRKLDDILLEPSDFVCWENEFCRPGLLATGAMGAIAGSSFMLHVIKEIMLEKTVIDDMAWKTVGPLRLTSVWQKYQYPLTIYPSHYFIPNHYTGYNYSGSGPVYANQLWDSTKRL